MAFADCERPGDLTDDDLEKFARYAERAYFSPELSSYLTVLFTSNFINPSFKPEKKREFVKSILHVFKEASDPALPPCAYCAKPSARLAHRDLVPMLTGREAVNFFPGGTPGLPLCGSCILALQALSIGAPMCSGRALVVFCDSPELTLQLVRAWQPEVRKRIQLSQTAGEKLSPMTRPLTRTIEALTSIESERADYGNSSLTVYHVSNSGQGPQADIHFLPSPVVQFVRRARAARYSAIWGELVHRAWEIPQRPKKGDRQLKAQAPSLRNYLYEDLFNLPERAGRFIRVYLLRKAIKYPQGPGDPRASYPGWKDGIRGLWDLTSLFLQEVIAMDMARVEAIRKVGDTLADEISVENDRKLWWRIYSGDAYRQVRLTLIQASKARLKRTLPPVLSLDEFLQVFEEGEELPRVDWRLAWDLVLIRIIEKLYQRKWFEKNLDVLKEEETEVEAKEA